MANSISVAVGDIDTIAVGFLAIVTGPEAVCTVTGNWAAAAVDAAEVFAPLVFADLVAPELEHPAARAAVAARAMRAVAALGEWLCILHPPVIRGGRSALAATPAG